ncbi:MAG: HAD family hydrolase, partial [Candidatus Saccharimonadales bacterium]
MTKKIIAFDLDDTLCRAKSPIDSTMAPLLKELLDYYDVCIITGGLLKQIQSQVLDNLELTTDELKKLHLMPTCGTQYYLYDEQSGDWAQQYAENLTDEQVERITTVLRESAIALDLWEPNPAGEIIENRGSQVTMSTLGQQANAEDKYAWDPTGEKKIAIRNH